jgi:glycosyltransferase involved in cell wall biosynthesis
MSAVPRLSIGLPVYNGASYLAESLEALLGQTYEDFELIISDNASTDGTAEICRRYAKQDSRIRYIRQRHNIGCAPNHNCLVDEARGELFKWASDDDLYARDMIRLCIEALDEYPHVVLAHPWTAFIDSSGTVTEAVDYPLATASLHAPERFRSMLFGNGGDDDGGVVRTSVLRRTAPYGSYHRADRTLVTGIALQGPFYQVPDWLYFRRDHPERLTRSSPGVRSLCAKLDPRRADRLRHPVVRLYGEYIWGFAAAVRSAPLSPADRRECYGYLAEWLASRALRGRPGPAGAEAPTLTTDISVSELVAGRERSPA